LLKSDDISDFINKMSMTADWSPLGDVFYRKFELYSMQWVNQVDLCKFIVSAAPYGGPIALIRYESKTAKINFSAKPTVYIFTSAGSEISNFRWNSGNLLKMGWSSVEDLICVQDDGSVLIYDIFGTFQRTFTMGQEAKDVKIIQSQIFQNFSGGTGIAVLTTSYRIFLVNNIDDVRIRRLADIPGLDVPPSCWSIINTTAQSKALVAKELDLYLLNLDGQCEKQVLVTSSDVESYIEMSVSFNNKYVALFTSTGLLWIGSSDLQTAYCEFDTKCHARPQQLVWCGPGAVVGYWENILLMVGPNKDWIKYVYDSALTLVPEIDGLRIISSTSHELLHRVPSVVEDVFKIGSMSPGAMLYEASQEFAKGSQRTDEYIHLIKDKLDVAVKQCIMAAGHEFEPAKQKLLLRAASFGKCFIPNYKSDEFVSMCQRLRVLNAIRLHNIGLPVSFIQLEHLTMPVVVDRLLMRHKYWLAMAICQYLKIPDSAGSSRVLAHWACYKIQPINTDDDEVSQAIATKLGDAPGVSYADIAHHASECGRNGVAIRLLNFEPKAAEQVPLLMKMNHDHLALTKAIESGDTDLIYLVILQLKGKLQLGEFLMALRTAPIAFSLYMQYLREQNPKILLDLYYQEDDHFSEANCRIIASYTEEMLDARLSSLVAAQEAYNKSHNECASKLTEEQIKLWRYQCRLEQEFSQPFLDKSLHETMYHLTLNNNHKLVEQMRKEFKVPDRRFWWMKILAVVENGDWAELDRFSKIKKSPIGYEPFFGVCLDKGNHVEALKYLPKVGHENLVKCHIKIGQLEQAAELAFHNKNGDELKLVLSKCGTSNKRLADRVNLMISQLSGGHK